MPLALQVAIIGAGPAGTFCALHLLRGAQIIGREIAVTLFDRKAFSGFGPSGCTMCAGVISHSLLQGLEGLGVRGGPSLVQREITASTLEPLGGPPRLDRPPASGPPRPTSRP